MTIRYRKTLIKHAIRFAAALLSVATLAGTAACGGSKPEGNKTVEANVLTVGTAQPAYEPWSKRF